MRCLHCIGGGGKIIKKKLTKAPPVAVVSAGDVYSVEGFGWGLVLGHAVRAGGVLHNTTVDEGCQKG